MSIQTDNFTEQRIIDAARGAKKESLQQIFDDLDAKWAAARKVTT